MTSLVLIGADASFRERVGAFFLPFDLRDAAGEEFRWDAYSVALVPFPDSARRARDIPKQVPFLGYGGAEHLVAAFESGAVDYLRDPWTENELRVRLDRVRASLIAPVEFADLRLVGTGLYGPRGEASLSPAEASLLRLLIKDAGKRVSRTAIRRFLWPGTPHESRVVDEAVSRLRRHFIVLSERAESLHIRSIRGYGYSLSFSDQLCPSCG